MPSPRAITRRSFLRSTGLAAGGLAGAGALSGCGAVITPGGSGTPVAYWNFFTGSDGARMVELIDAYRAEDPAVNVTATTLMWGAPYYTKLAMACEGGRAPDLATLHATRLPVFAQELVEPWDLDELSARGVALEDFPQPVLDRVMIGDQLMALPLDTHPFVLYYNTDICEQLDLLDSDGQLKALDSPELLLDAGKRAAEVTGSSGIAFGGNDALMCWELFWSLYSQQGAAIELPIGGKAEVDRDAMVQSMTFMADLCDGTIASQTLDGAGASALFASEQTAFMMQGVWEIVTAETAGIPFSMTLLPALFGDKHIARADSHTFVLPRQTKQDDATLTATYDLAVSMLNNSLSWAGGGHVPALSAVVDSADYQHLKPQSNYQEAAELAAFDPKAYFAGSGSNLMSRAFQDLGAVCSHAMTPDAGADDLVGWLNDQLQLPAPV